MTTVGDLVCRKCGKNAQQVNDGVFLKRMNPTGVAGIWECFPSCDYRGIQNEGVLRAIMGDDYVNDSG